MTRRDVGMLCNFTTALTHIREIAQPYRFWGLLGFPPRSGCKDYGAYKVLEPTVRYGQGRKEEILRAYQERSSLQDISRTFGVSRPTVSAWLKKTPAAAKGGG